MRSGASPLWLEWDSGRSNSVAINADDVLDIIDDPPADPATAQQRLARERLAEYNRASERAERKRQRDSWVKRPVQALLEFGQRVPGPTEFVPEVRMSLPPDIAAAVRKLMDASS
jgi:hypothetical protein